jgi:hypothetical protein
MRARTCDAQITSMHPNKQWARLIFCCCCQLIVSTLIDCVSSSCRVLGGVDGISSQGRIRRSIYPAPCHMYQHVQITHSTAVGRGGVLLCCVDVEGGGEETFERSIVIRRDEEGGSCRTRSVASEKCTTAAVHAHPIVGRSSALYGMGDCVRWRSRGYSITWTYPRIAPRFFSPVSSPFCLV